MASGSSSPANCLVEFSNVCVQPRAVPKASSRVLYIDESSRCNHQRCRDGHGWAATFLSAADAHLRPLWRHGPFGDAGNGLLFQRFPIVRVCGKSSFAQRECTSTVVHALAEAPSYKGIALLPAGLDPEETLTRPLHNMNHLLRDHLLHEVDILRRVPNISIVLGNTHWARFPLNVAHYLRRQFFEGRGVEFRLPPHADHGCFEKLYTYPWSCDRDLGRYSTDVSSIRLLRKLLPFAPPAAVTTTKKPTALLYGRRDARRRRLLNLTAHFTALRSRLSGSFDVVLWDDVWQRAPSVKEQAEIILSAKTLITPHGAWPSVWGLFLQPGAAIVELFSACMTYTWLPKPILKQLGLRHYRLGRNLGKMRQLVDAQSGKIVHGCPQWPHDPDLLIEPAERLATRVERLLAR